VLPSADSKLVQIVDAAFADAARRSGEWLVCRPGCTQCCHGVFEITLLDAARLQEGLRGLRANDPKRAARVRVRAEEAVARLSPTFPGDVKTGMLNGDEEAFERFADEEPCPALDPETGTCDLYAARPITCRVFGPPVKQEGGLGVCELCFQGATDEEVSRCEMVPDPEDLESQLVCEVEDVRGEEGYTIVAFALVREGE
jgi:Fe-S-cluster containining protein